MGNFVFNQGLGRVAELYKRVDDNDPTNAVLVLVIINTATADATLKDLDTLSALLADGGTAEVTNSGYARVVLDDTDVAFTVDDTNDRVDLDFADQTFTSVAAGDAWTDAVICYDGDSTGGTDANIVPLTQHDFAITPDGSNIVLQVAATGFYRAS